MSFVLKSFEGFGADAHFSVGGNPHCATLSLKLNEKEKEGVATPGWHWRQKQKKRS
jgi:hypothetical protein